MDGLSRIVTYIQLCLYGIVYYFTVLLLSHNRPTIYLDNFNVVSLRNTSNSLTNNATIYLDLRIKNENSLIGIYYEDPLNLTITYLPPTKSAGSNVTIGQCAIQGFYQGSGEVKQIQLSVVVQDLFPSTEQRRRLGETHVSLYGSAKVIDFIVDLEANIKFMLFENTKSHLMIRSGVEVNDNTGTSVLKTIEMKYASGSNKWGVVKWLMTVPLSLLFHFVFYCACWLAFQFFSFVFLCPSN
ncbi:unnamed protein product [Lactuca virosa]|uniref:Late embryogenesis abundant protein LEA-2 subgroup domain-containing protein n=1 Tax=Lactuca virosa TaxID=75947 RepID=A0AAU9PTG1_9ASTR|nr:unnamed protein product [Lactuca virosa]